jgi:hypothetical protein
MLKNEGKAMLANKNNTTYIIAASINNNIKSFVFGGIFCQQF